MGISFHCFLLYFLTVVARIICTENDVVFDKNYHTVWASDHTKLLNNGKGIMLTCDQSSGSAFQSYKDYVSGSFYMRIKLPKPGLKGVLAAYYLMSHTNAHDEIDFEFLGDENPPYKLHTNVFANGQGGREQQFQFWFDPTEDFHTYKILWNQHQIAFFVDDIPIRVFRNNSKYGLGYPTQGMKIEGSIYHAEWSSGGKPVNWTRGPFKVEYYGAEINGCPVDKSTQDCRSPKFWWNQQKFWTLDSHQLSQLHDMRRKYKTHDYCDNTKDSKISLECKYNQ